MDLRVAAYAVVERRGKILLTHWRRGHLHGWTLPGGGIDPGEDPRDAVVREVMEETGLEAKVGRLLGVDSRVMVREEVSADANPELHTIRIVYRATVVDGPLRNEVGGSSDEARWVSLKDLKDLKTLSLVQTALRMAGIARRTPGNQGKSGSGKSAVAKQGSGAKPGTAKTGATKSGTAKPSSAKQGSGRSRQRNRNQQGKSQQENTQQNNTQQNNTKQASVQQGNVQGNPQQG